MLAGPPENDTPIPDSVMRYARKRPIEVVWLNDLGGLTFRIKGGVKDTFIKWAPINSDLGLDAEQIKLEWASAFTPVPKVLEFGRDIEGSWLATEGIDAENAVSERWKRDPAIAVVAIGRGLRAMHDALPVDECPFSWSAQDRILRARGRIVGGKTDPTQWHEEFRGLSTEAALKEISSPPPDDLVVCHGDACAPNTLIDRSGQWAGNVDMARLGIADRWADLAVAAWSTQWNYGLGWEDLLYDSYGIDPDIQKIHFYRLLWDLDE
ncbi:MAG: aminoglycoside 3'-phosphotransferase [Candidatus Nanopelagicaceae bacterium]|nr:aminoglycoside 3'-phosphotransferase [Candidatus Nanopelagicaceae bacterium]